MQLAERVVETLPDTSGAFTADPPSDWSRRRPHPLPLQKTALTQMRRPKGASSFGVTASASDTVFALRGRDKALRSYQLHGTGDTCLRRL